MLYPIYMQLKLNLSFVSKLLLASLLLLLILLFVVVVTIFRVRQVNNHAHSAIHARQVLVHANKFLTAILENESNAKSFMLTNDADYLGRYHKSEQDIFSELAYLKKLNAGSIQSIDSLTLMINEKKLFLSSVLSIHGNGEAQVAAGMMENKNRKNVDDSIRQVIQSIQLIHRLLLDEAEHTSAGNSRKLYDALFTIAGLLGAIVCIFIQQIKSDSQEKKQTIKTLVNLNHKLEYDVKQRTAELKKSKLQVDDLLQKISETFATLEEKYKFINYNIFAEENKNPDLELTGKGNLQINGQSFQGYTLKAGNTKIGPYVNDVNYYTKSISNRYQQELKQVTAQLAELTQQVHQIKAEERKRIGRELHDELGQQLTAIKMNAAWISKKIPDEEILVKDKIKCILHLLDMSHGSIRKILNELRPDILKTDGIEESFRRLGEQFFKNTGIPVHFDFATTGKMLPEKICVCILRIYQEALTNISKYAEAKNVYINLNILPEKVFLCIKDDGKGFSTEEIGKRNSYGILGMKERLLSVNGDFGISSVRGKGTTIRISILTNQ